MRKIIERKGSSLELQSLSVSWQKSFKKLHIDKMGRKSSHFDKRVRNKESAGGEYSFRSIDGRARMSKWKFARRFFQLFSEGRRPITGVLAARRDIFEIDEQRGETIGGGSSRTFEIRAPRGSTWRHRERESANRLARRAAWTTALTCCSLWLPRRRRCRRRPPYGRPFPLRAQDVLCNPKRGGFHERPRAKRRLKHAEESAAHESRPHDICALSARSSLSIAYHRQARTRSPRQALLRPILNISLLTVCPGGVYGSLLSSGPRENCPDDRGIGGSLVLEN